MTGTFSPSEYELRPHRRLLPAGTELWRVHSAKRSAEQFNTVSVDAHFGGNRFDGTPYDPYPYLYVADSPTTALAETLLRSMEFDKESRMRLIPYAAVRAKSLSVVRTRCEVNLVSLVTETDLAAVCQDSWLLEDEGERYAKTRRWASEIRTQATDAMGLIWQSRRNRPHRALVLFGDRFESCGNEPLDGVPLGGIPDLGSPSGVTEANRLLAPLQAAIVPPWSD
ncbi:RES family NAD+ phosphorylase [Streptomyces sp. 35G-GA-8]|uniref:RES family NAD+ phosphorylase n=1 Tax=Streptomyces sp. 35G-GA-8 TaxID=2939434 RepID=UPI00201EC9A0|nr:RES family NAD+ phosphorylase [Streptomyces sp. 35G-GA-8]MCL7375941.1 RES family NAD+ phosphorylase [Streptomyces sp. 35G-GA-8]